MFSVQPASQGAGQMRPGNDVVDRAAAVAERDAAVHAARALHLGLVVRQADSEFLVMLDARGRWLGRFLQALELQKAGYFTHFFYSPRQPRGVVPRGIVDR
jgi:hypothetical protein